MKYVIAKHDFNEAGRVFEVWAENKEGYIAAYDMAGHATILHPEEIESVIEVEDKDYKTAKWELEPS
jgi:hypothetical protein